MPKKGVLIKLLQTALSTAIAKILPLGTSTFARAVLPAFEHLCEFICKLLFCVLQYSHLTKPMASSSTADIFYMDSEEQIDLDALNKALPDGMIARGTSFIIVGLEDELILAI